MQSARVKAKLTAIKTELRIAEQHTVNALNHLRDLQKELGKKEVGE